MQHDDALNVAVYLRLQPVTLSGKKFRNFSNFKNLKTERRNRADLLEVSGSFQDVQKGLSTTPFNNFFVLQTATRTRGHTTKRVKNSCRLDLGQHFFSERVLSTAGMDWISV